ncbi:hypothetical protein ACFVYD_17080 [Streptomyces sp. NPDC058301]|uniref:hypothetical protein n=1 Tax=Streptomyces sp. NPDC058301 TaxID=3346436 RepID=UPI0036E9C7E0
MPKAYAYTRNGGPATETSIERDRPRPGPGQLLIAVRAAGADVVGHARGEAVIEVAA